MPTQAQSSAERGLRKEAEEMLRKGTTATAFSARFFGPGGGLQQLAAEPEDRREVVGSELYRWLQTSLAELRRKEATEFDRQVASVSGRLTVVVPKSLHAALKNEARAEGVSLSELVRLKLSLPYRQTAGWLLVGEAQSRAGQR
jgi:predicted HicB family RNase H-like nuclease